jgi:hypothetical protein
MITPEQVLTATPEELRRWCGLLQYGEARDMWVYPWPDGGHWCTDEQREPDSTLQPCAAVLVREDGTRYSWRPLPDYTQSLDAIWPLQERASKSPRFAQVVDGWLNEPLSMIYWPPEELVRCIVASAEQRARAVCLTLLDELNALFSDHIGDVTDMVSRVVEEEK